MLRGGVQLVEHRYAPSPAAKETLLFLRGVGSRSWRRPWSPLTVTKQSVTRVLRAAFPLHRAVIKAILSGLGSTSDLQI